MLSVQETLLGNICQLLLILILTLGVSCQPQPGTGEEWERGRWWITYPSTLSFISPSGRRIDKPGHSLLVVPQVNPHPLTVLGLLEGTPCLVSFASNFGISYLVQPERKEPPWPLSTDFVLKHWRPAPHPGSELRAHQCCAQQQNKAVFSVPLCFSEVLAVPACWAGDFRELSVIHFLVATISKFSITYTQVGLFFLGWISLN